jgi:hypothetical protein
MFVEYRSCLLIFQYNSFRVLVIHGLTRELPAQSLRIVREERVPVYWHRRLGFHNDPVEFALPAREGRGLDGRGGRHHPTQAGEMMTLPPPRVKGLLQQRPQVFMCVLGPVVCLNTQDAKGNDAEEVDEAVHVPTAVQGSLNRHHERRQYISPEWNPAKWASVSECPGHIKNRDVCPVLVSPTRPGHSPSRRSD